MGLFNDDWKALQVPKIIKNVFIIPNNLKTCYLGQNGAKLTHFYLKIGQNGSFLKYCQNESLLLQFGPNNTSQVNILLSSSYLGVWQPNTSFLFQVRVINSEIQHNSYFQLKKYVFYGQNESFLLQFGPNNTSLVDILMYSSNKVFLFWVKGDKFRNLP